MEVRVETVEDGFTSPKRPRPTSNGVFFRALMAGSSRALTPPVASGFFVEVTVVGLCWFLMRDWALMMFSIKPRFSTAGTSVGAAVSPTARLGMSEFFGGIEVVAVGQLVLELFGMDPRQESPTQFSKMASQGLDVAFWQPLRKLAARFAGLPKKAERGNSQSIHSFSLGFLAPHGWQNERMGSLTGASAGAGAGAGTGEEKATEASAARRREVETAFILMTVIMGYIGDDLVAMALCNV
jgi:hypothetical protein